MKKYLLVLLTLFCIACGGGDPTTINKIEITSNKSGDSWKLSDNQTAVTLTAKTLNSSGTDLGQSVEWSDNFPDGTKTTTTDTTFSFSLTDLNTLGDWQVKAKCGDKEGIFSFNLGTDKSLDESVVYSKTSLENMIKDGDNYSIIEFDNAGNRIETESARMSVASSIDYYGTLTSYLYITTNDAKSFGKLSATLDNSVDGLKVIESDDGSILIGGIDFEGDDKELKLKIKAGNQSKDVVINLKQASKLTLTAKIADEVSSNIAGYTIAVTGDSVSNYEYATDNQTYSLAVEVTRLNEDTSDYEPYYYRSNLETKYIQYGEQLHLADAGHTRYERELRV